MGRGESILVIDDDAAVLRLMTQILARAGFTVISAAGADEALALFGRRRPEIGLLVCDVMMPGMNGPDLVERLSAGDPGLPVLFVSGYSRSDLLNERIVARGLPLLLKPFTVTALVEKTREVMGALREKSRAGGTMAS